MFTTCIHCTADLGRNAAFEVFPVGTRLAFDAARGRLWVVCGACDRWNLSPLEERWEAADSGTHSSTGDQENPSGVLRSPMVAWWMCSDVMRA